VLYIRHYNTSSNWFILFRLRNFFSVYLLPCRERYAADQTTIPSGYASVDSNHLGRTGSGIHAAWSHKIALLCFLGVCIRVLPHSPFPCHSLVCIAIFKLRIGSLKLQTFAAVRAVIDLLFRYTVLLNSSTVLVQKSKSYPNYFLHFFAEHLMTISAS